jgi:hypothetical protein
VIRKGKRGMTVGYSQRSGVTTDPTLPDVLNCLAMDASALQSSFEEWCGEYGYDVDSRKAEKIFRICRRQGQSLLRILGGQAALDDLMYQTERL